VLWSAMAYGALLLKNGTSAGHWGDFVLLSLLPLIAVTHLSVLIFSPRSRETR
jgi:hypothetical protein